jgi:hypothetical protein
LSLISKSFPVKITEDGVEGSYDWVRAYRSGEDCIVCLRDKIDELRFRILPDTFRKFSDEVGETIIEYTCERI